MSDSTSPGIPRPRRRVPGRARTSEQARAAAHARWGTTPDKLDSEAIKRLFDRASKLTPEQITELRAVIDKAESTQDGA